MRPPVGVLSAAALLLCAAWGCQQTPDPPTPDELDPHARPTVAGRPGTFSEDRAWDDLRALAEIGPRVVGTEGNAKARQYIQNQLEQLNLEVEVHERDLAEMLQNTDGEEESESTEPKAESLFVRNVSATIPGSQNEGSILLVAPYDTRSYDDFEFVGVNDGGSGAAVLLELARAIAADPLPYATHVVFLDGQAPFELEIVGPARRGAGMARLAERMRDRDASDVHLAVYMNRVGDADLRIARDLLSHRIYRDQFWDAAQRLGESAAFAPDASFESTGLKHRPLGRVGIRRIVSVVDTAYGGEEPPGLYAGTEQDTLQRCSPESLGSVGRVVLEGLDAISQWLLRIDQFSRRPSDAAPEGVETGLETGVGTNEAAEDSEPTETNQPDGGDT